MLLSHSTLFRSEEDNRVNITMERRIGSTPVSVEYCGTLFVAYGSEEAAPFERYVRKGKNH